jgi:hypothetical protein
MPDLKVFGSGMVAKPKTLESGMLPDLRSLNLTDCQVEINMGLTCLPNPN